MTKRVRVSLTGSLSNDLDSVTAEVKSPEDFDNVVHAIIKSWTLSYGDTIRIVDAADPVTDAG